MRNGLSFFLLMLPASLSAQAPSYKAPSTDVFVATTNPFRMYWLRGKDTLGSPVRELTLERQSWSRSGGALRVVINHLTLDAARHDTTDTIVVEPNGRVTSINGKMPGVHGHVDFLLRLPTEPLARGITWTDTLSTRSEGVGGEHHYTIQRRYAVVGTLDTLGRHLNRISATGTVAYRDAWWVDSTKGTVYSIDVAGPVTESFLFDARAGQLVVRSWKMNLRGSGMFPNDRGGSDSLRAGLLSEETQALLEPALANVVGRSLPPGDTSITVTADKGRLFVHTVRRNADTIEAGFARNGGLVGSARVVFSKSSPISYRATWTDAFGSPQIESVERRGTSLTVSHHGVETALALPASAWGIADYAMQELLGPVMLSLPNDGAKHPLAIYRPYAAHWDSGTVVVRNLGDARIAVVQMRGDKKPQALIITNDGDYLYGENSDPVDAERLPTLGSSRRTKLEALLRQIRGR